MADQNPITSIDDKITKDGSSGYKAESGRYHLYTNPGCPFAHRVTIAIALKGLENVFTVDIVDPVNDGINGWHFNPNKNGCTIDTVNGKEYLRETYKMSHPNYTGRITIPVIYDKRTNKIVNNESAQIIRMLNTEFNEFSSSKEKAELDLYSQEKQQAIEDIYQWINPTIVFGVYAVRNASSQEKYDQAVNKLFSNLDKVDELLSKSRYLTGSQLSEADICLFVTLIRFDVAFYSLYRCNKKMISQYPNLWGYTRDIYQQGNVRHTVDFQHIKQMHFFSQKVKNLPPVIPIGPILNFDEESNRFGKM